MKQWIMGWEPETKQKQIMDTLRSITQKMVHYNTCPSGTIGNTFRSLSYLLLWKCIHMCLCTIAFYISSPIYEGFVSHLHHTMWCMHDANFKMWFIKPFKATLWGSAWLEKSGVMQHSANSCAALLCPGKTFHGHCVDVPIQLPWMSTCSHIYHCW